MLSVYSESRHWLLRPSEHRPLGTGGVTRMGEEWKMSPITFGRGALITDPPSALARLALFCSMTSYPRMNWMTSRVQSSSCVYVCRVMPESEEQKSSWYPPTLSSGVMAERFELSKLISVGSYPPEPFGATV